MNRVLIGVIGLAAGVAIGAGTAYWLAGRSQHTTAAPAASAPSALKSERRVLYWYDPMYPQQRFDKPGKSPYMDMQLVPKYADEGVADGGVAVSPRTMQNLGVRTVEVARGSLAPKLTAVGSVEYNERSVVVVQPRANGFIERLYVRAPLDAVRQGDPLVEMLIPEWAGAQEEYLLLRRRDEPASRELAAAARQRLVLLGIGNDQIAAIERSGVVQPRITLRAPVSGVIAELGARQGMTVNAGTTLFRIASLGTVWVVAEVPESHGAMITPGSRVDVHLPAYPNEKLSGRVGAILPEVNAATRTLRARVEVANSGGRLKPGMYANVDFSPRAREALIVPSDAVIRTGTRDVVIVADGGGQFHPVEVQVGLETSGSTEINKGLKAGDRVVVSGQFLIDSEASLRTTLDRMKGAPTGGEPVAPKADAGASAAAPKVHRATGKVAAIDAARGRVELEHGAIPTLKWPPMTMGFLVSDKSQIARIRKGDTVEFELNEKPTAEGDYVIARIAPAGASR